MVLLLKLELQLFTLILTPKTPCIVFMYEITRVYEIFQTVRIQSILYIYIYSVRASNNDSLLKSIWAVYSPYLKRIDGRIPEFIQKSILIYPVSYAAHVFLCINLLCSFRNAACSIHTISWISCMLPATFHFTTLSHPTTNVSCSAYTKLPFGCS